MEFVNIKNDKLLGDYYLYVNKQEKKNDSKLFYTKMKIIQLIHLILVCIFLFYCFLCTTFLWQLLHSIMQLSILFVKFLPLPLI